MKSDQGEFLFVISFYYFVLAFLSSPSSFSSESHFQEGTAGIYIYIKKNLYGWRCLKVNNLASCWLVAALTVGEEGGGENPPPKKNQPFRLTQWHALRQRERAQRQGGRRKGGKRQQQTEERYPPYQDPNGMGKVSANPTAPVSFLKTPSSILPCVAFLGFRGLNPPS